MREAGAEETELTSKEKFLRRKEYVNRHPQVFRGMRLLSSLITGIVFVSYPVLLVILLLQSRFSELLPAVLVPGISFVLLSFLRGRVNAPRPYEVWGIEPLVPKETRGHSHPSRHLFSIYVLAMVWASFYPPVGLTFLVLGVYLGWYRVYTGIHFTRDVLAGAVCGLAAGAVMFLI